MIKLFVDGACSGNPGPGGWGLVLLKENKIIKELSGFAPQTTNNRMELQAAIEGIKLVKNYLKNPQFTLYTDSIYVKEGITKWIISWKKTNWKKGTIKNIDLWLLLDEAGNSCDILWQWVKGHSGNIYNERADCLARKEIQNNS